jgi:hypothetical protein
MEPESARTGSEGGTDGARFLFEEYKNVAATHDKLRDVIVRIFNYFLLLSAAPFTVAGIMYQAGGFNLLQAPPSVHILFIVVGVAHLFLALTILDARLSQYRYARTVNAIRQYFAETHREIAPYLYLPTDRTNPPFTRLGYVGIQLRLVWVVGALFAGYGVWGLRHILPRGAGIVAALAFVLYIAIYFLILRIIVRRYERGAA